MYNFTILQNCNHLSGKHLSADYWSKIAMKSYTYASSNAGYMDVVLYN